MIMDAIRTHLHARAAERALFRQASAEERARFRHAADIAVSLPVAPGLVHGWLCAGWSETQIREHVELALALGRDPACFCPQVHLPTADA